MARTLEFSSYNVDFVPMTSIQAYLPSLGISTTETYVIADVEISETTPGYFLAHVVAQKRRESDVSTQRKPDMVSFFKFY